MKNMFLITTLSLLASVGLSLAKDQHYQIVDGSGSDIGRVTLRRAASRIDSWNTVSFQSLKFIKDNKVSPIICGMYAKKGSLQFYPFTYDDGANFVDALKTTACP